MKKNKGNKNEKEAKDKEDSKKQLLMDNYKYYHFICHLSYITEDTTIWE